MSTVYTTQDQLNTEAETEAAKFGEDVKFLAEFTNREIIAFKYFFFESECGSIYLFYTNRYPDK